MMMNGSMTMMTNTTTMDSEKEDFMEDKLSADDIEDFNGYLVKCTDKQVLGVLEKEIKAGRKAYAALAREEARKRDIY